MKETGESREPRAEKGEDNVRETGDGRPETGGLGSERRAPRAEWGEVNAETQNSAVSPRSLTMGSMKRAPCQPVNS